MDRSEKTRLIIINQSTNPAFIDWVVSLADDVGSVALWCGNPPGGLGDKVVVRQGPGYDKGSTFLRLKTWGLFTLWSAWCLLRYPGGKRIPIFVVTNPPFMPLLAWVMGKVQKRPFALLEWDIYPQILSPMGLAGRRNPLYQLWYRGHRAALLSAGRIITISEGMADTLQEMAEGQPLLIDVIPNWVDTEWIRPLKRTDNSFAVEQAFGDKLVVMYAGNLGATHALETVIETAVLLGDEPDICFVCIGEGSKRPLIEEAIASGKTPTLRLLDRQPVERLPETLASADVGIVTLAEGYEALSMPSKTYGVLAAGSALLGISQQPNDLQCLIETTGCGVNFAPPEAAAIADWLRQMNRERTALRQMQAKARETAVSQFSRVQCEKGLTAVMQEWLAGDQ